MNMAPQCIIRQGTNPHIKCRQGTPEEGKGFQEEVKELETTPLPVRNLTRRPGCTTVTYTQRT